MASRKRHLPPSPQKPAKTPKRASGGRSHDFERSTFPTPPSTGRYTQHANVNVHHDPPSSSMPLPYSSQHFTQEDRDAWLEDEDYRAIVPLSQDDAEFNDQLHLYGNLRTKVVGLQYYKGSANPGEQILIRREPSNQYDTNAIRIDNVSRTQIGHIPRAIAQKLASYTDTGSLTLEGRLNGVLGSFDCPLLVQMYGPDPASARGRDLREKMLNDRLPIDELIAVDKRREKLEADRLAAARRNAVTSKNSSFSNQPINTGTKRDPVMLDIMEASQRINPRELANSAERLGVTELDLERMPKATKPDAIKTDMLPYQLQALQWLLDQESPPAPGTTQDASIQLWSKKNGLYMNLATNYSIRELPKLASGGILADDMGLGKTLEMISLIVADAEKFGRGITLVVAPLSVMSNWSGQIAHHIKEQSALKVYTYHASGRVKMSAADFSNYDIIITTYATLANDYMPGKNDKQPERKLRPHGLYSVDWRRIILDEGHQVRNSKTKGALAVCGLIGRSRWVLTGTPIVNSLGDLYSLLRFIGVTGGLEQLEIFNRVLVRPIKTGDDSATMLLKLIMKSFTLRRRKDMSFIDLKLPKLEEFVHRIDFTEKEQQRYDALFNQATGMMKSYEQKSRQGGKASSTAYCHLLEVLLRLRQCCNHWQLCRERVTKLMEQLDAHKTVALTEENKKALQDVLQIHIESQEDCAVCLDTLHNPVITTCGHVFGQECIAKVISTQQKCPMCRAPLADETVLVEPPTGDFGDSDEEDLDLSQSSSKLEALMRILGATKGDGNNKTVIFSQWTRYLDIVQARLDRDGFKYCRLDGTMSAGKRDEALLALEHDTNTTIMLASLGVCAVGLNLTAANNVVLSDTWWAPAIEDQAVDRVHRLGQKRETRVFRLVMDKSIEERTLSVQADKRKLMMVAFSEKQNKRGSAKQGRIADIQRLLSGSSNEDTVSDKENEATAGHEVIDVSD